MPRLPLVCTIPASEFEQHCARTVAARQIQARLDARGLDLSSLVTRGRVPSPRGAFRVRDVWRSCRRGASYRDPLGGVEDLEHAGLNASSP
jgi:hypothetical protein